MSSYPLFIVTDLDLFEIILFGNDLALVSLRSGSRATLGSRGLGILVLLITLFFLIVLEVSSFDLFIVLCFGVFVVLYLFRLRGLALLGFGFCERA